MFCSGRHKQSHTHLLVYIFRHCQIQWILNIVLFYRFLALSFCSYFIFFSRAEIHTILPPFLITFLTTLYWLSSKASIPFSHSVLMAAFQSLMITLVWLLTEVTLGRNPIQPLPFNVDLTEENFQIELYAYKDPPPKAHIHSLCFK